MSDCPICNGDKRFMPVGGSKQTDVTDCPRCIKPKVTPRERWAHVGCETCGMVTTVPLDRLEPPPWCVHNGTTVIWRAPHPDTQAGAHPWTRMVRVAVASHPQVAAMTSGDAEPGPDWPAPLSTARRQAHADAEGLAFLKQERTWDELDSILNSYDSAFDVNVASACAWSGQLRLTLTNPDGAPSRSVTFFAAGEASPVDVAARVLADAERWMTETGTTPMPVPAWMTTRRAEGAT